MAQVAAVAQVQSLAQELPHAPDTTKKKKKTKHTHTKQKTKSNVPLYSTGNYIQYPEIDHVGKEYKKESIYVSLSHFAIQQKLAQHCK